ncbi:MAG TPA: GntR family transcriptional regulator [Caproiciproducens sp.]|nr:GntR family transcriptional regulator [Caproiciproducens sp.]
MPDSINHNSDVAMYKQLTNIIMSQIESGQLKSGDKVPSETELLKRYKVSRITVRAAISELVEDGVLVRSQGKGTFVASPKVMYEANDHIGFTRSCLLAGKAPSTKLLKSDLVFPPASIKKFLNIGDDEKVIMTERLHSVDEKPISIETNHYPLSFSFLLNEDLEKSLFELLQEKYHIVIAHSERTLEVCFPTAYEANLLNIKQSTPLLLFKDKQTDADHKPLFASKQVYCTENLKFYL